jgi:hypothetical protein
VRSGTSVQAARAPAVTACPVEAGAGAGRPATAAHYPDPGRQHTVAGAQALMRALLLPPNATSAGTQCAGSIHGLCSARCHKPLASPLPTQWAPAAACQALPPYKHTPHVLPRIMYCQSWHCAPAPHVLQPQVPYPHPCSHASAGTSAAAAHHPSGAATAGHPAGRPGASTRGAAAATAAAGHHGGPLPSRWCRCPGPARSRPWQSRSGLASCRAGSLG